jgi:hypothetical protein
MPELQAPLGAFFLVELDPGLHPSRVEGLYCNITDLPGVRSCADLACISIELLNEKVLMRLTPDEQKAWARATRKPRASGDKA